jgi:NAD(P)-dependent dehydrogenase (short-subunit alcohol dehydrogenase family)
MSFIVNNPLRSRFSPPNLLSTQPFLFPPLQGVETARALVVAGADVIITSRNLEAGEKVAEEIRKTPDAKGTIKVMQLDLADLESVKKFATTDASPVLSSTGLQLLICNAGVMACPKMHTEQGFELQIGTNHIGHFYMTKLLMPHLEKAAKDAAAAARPPPRVVVVSSYAHTFDGLDVDDLNWEKRTYKRWPAYGQSKLSNILFVKQLALQFKENNLPVLTFSLHPGSIMTSLQRHIPGSFLAGPFIRLLGKTIPQGASTTVYAAVSEDLKDQSGAYLQDCKVAKPILRAQDAELAKKLWEKTEELISNAGF